MIEIRFVLTATIRETLRQGRLAQGKSQDDVGKMAQVSGVTISHIENGQRKTAPLTLLRTLRELLRVELGPLPDKPYKDPGKKGKSFWSVVDEISEYLDQAEGSVDPEQLLCRFRCRPHSKNEELLTELFMSKGWKRGEDLRWVKPRPAKPRSQEAMEHSDRVVLDFMKRRRGFWSTTELSKELGLTPSQVAKTLQRLEQGDCVLRMGNTRFTKYLVLDA